MMLPTSYCSACHKRQIEQHGKGLTTRFALRSTQNMDDDESIFQNSLQLTIALVTVATFFSN